MPKVNDERYINNMYLNAIIEQYHKESRFSNIPLEDKRRILERIRHRLSHVIYMDDRIDGEKLTSQALLNLEKINNVPLSSLHDLDISFLYACIIKNLERIAPIFSYYKVSIPQDGNHPTLTQEYLEMISDVTKYLIKEVASSFVPQHTNKQLHINKSSTELKSSLKRKAPETDFTSTFAKLK